MTRRFTAYIDEAGDEGFGKLTAGTTGGQSLWLILGSLVVEGAHDRSLPGWRDAILDRFPNKKTRELHFRDLHHEQKVVVSQEIASRDIRTCLRLWNKAGISGTPQEEALKSRGALYHHLVVGVLEGVTRFCRQEVGESDARLKVVFSRRTGTSYDTMRRDLLRLRDGTTDGGHGSKIDWGLFDPKDIRVEVHSRLAGLQLADCITSAYFRAVEPNAYGNLEPGYADILDRKLIDFGGRTAGSGILALPAMDALCFSEEQKRFFRRYGTPD